jgi:hypothetical protein
MGLRLVKKYSFISYIGTSSGEYVQANYLREFEHSKANDVNIKETTNTISILARMEGYTRIRR